MDTQNLVLLRILLIASERDSTEGRFSELVLYEQYEYVHPE